MTDHLSPGRTGVLLAVALLLPAASALAQAPIPLTAVEPQLKDVTHGALGAPFFTYEQTSTAGVMNLRVTTNNGVLVTGRISARGPASVTGTVSQTSLVMTPPQNFTVTAEMNSNARELRIANGTTVVDGGTLNLNASSLGLDGNPPSAVLAVTVAFRAPITPGSQFEGSQMRFLIWFRWQLDTCAAPQAAALQGKPSATRTADACPAITITPPVATNDPDAPYAKPRAPGAIRAIIKGSNFPSNGTVSLGDVTLDRVTFKSSTEIEAFLSGFEDLREGPRDLEITSPTGQKIIGREAFFVSSLIIRLEVNQGVPMKCDVTVPCIADHNTVVRVKVDCNRPKPNGDGCQVGKERITGRLNVYKNGTLLALSPFKPKRRLRVSNDPSEQTRSEGRDTLNYMFTLGGYGLFQEGLYGFEFQIDPRRPDVFPESVPDTDLLTKSATNSEGSPQLVFKRSNRPADHEPRGSIYGRTRVSTPFGTAKIAVGLDPQDKAIVNEAELLRWAEYLRAVYPASRSSIEVTIVPNAVTWSKEKDDFSDDFAERTINSALSAFAAGLAGPPIPRHVTRLPYTHLLFYSSGSPESGSSQCGPGSLLGALPGVINPTLWRCWGMGSVAKIHKDAQGKALEGSMGAMPHELGHHYWLGDTSNGGGNLVNPRLPLQNAGDCVYGDGCAVEDGHMDTILGTVSVNPFATDRNERKKLLKRDFMGTVDRPMRWVNRFTWDYLYPLFNEVPAAQPGTNQNDKLQPETARRAEDDPVESINVLGSVTEAGEVQFDPATFVLASPPAPDSTEAGSDGASGYTVEIQDAAGQSLGASAFSPIFQAGHSERPLKRAIISVTLPYPASGAARIVVKKQGQSIGAREITPNAPVVQLVAPTPGTTLSGVVKLKWEAFDPDGGTLIHTVIFSPDDGATWIPLSGNGTATELDLDTALLPGTRKGRFAVITTDGVNSSDATLGPFTVAPKPPVIAVASPEDGESVEAGDPVSIHVLAWDPQDRESLDVGETVIRSNRDGILGRAAALTTDKLSPGHHRITVVRTNSAGLSTEAGVTISVAPPPGTPAPVPSVEASAATVDFGSVAIGATADRAVTLRNTGTAPRIISAVTSSNPLFTRVSPAVPITLAAGASQNLTLRFAPTAAGPQTGILTLATDDPERLSIAIALTGAGTTAPPASGALRLQRIDVVRTYGEGGVENAFRQNASLEMWTIVPLRETAAATAREFPFGFHYRWTDGASGPPAQTSLPNENRTVGTLLLTDVPNEVTPGASARFAAKLSGEWRTSGYGVSRDHKIFLTGAAGSGNATGPGALNVPKTVSLDSSATTAIPQPTAGAVTMAFTGWIQFGNDHVARLELRVIYGSGGTSPPPPAPTPAIDVTPTSADFGAVAIGTTADRTLVIRNTGTVTRSVTGVSSSNPQFVRVSPPLPFSIGAGSFQNLLLRYGPTTAGAQNATLTITTDDPARPTITVPLTGVGTGNTPPLGAAIVFEPSSLAFQANEAGQIKLVRAVNMGNVPIDILDITSSNRSFEVLFGSITQSGANGLNIPVRFNPIGAGIQTGIIALITNPPVAGAQFNVTGNGGGGGSSGGSTSTKAQIVAAAGWPNGRVSNNLPSNAIDGNTSTFTWTTESFNSANPSYLGIGFAFQAAVNRVRIYKDNDAGGPGLVGKNLTIEYTTSPTNTPLANRTWTPVTGLVNGFGGAEFLNATAVNSNGSVLNDNHDSRASGWASLTFNTVEATGIRIGFSNATPISVNHYRVYELEAYGGGGASSQQTVAASPSTVARGGQVTVTWTALNTDLRDNWVGLYAENAPTDSANLLRPAWTWVSAAAGSATFTAPATPGRYVFWYFLDGGYSRPSAKSNPFTVQ